jgi:uncharacterized membrane protein
MNTVHFIKKEWLQLLILIAPFVIIAFVWNQMPERIPIHWDYQGHANGYGSKGLGLFLLPIINIGIAALLGSLSKVDPKAWKMNLPSTGLKPLRLVITGFLFAIFCVTILASLGTNINVQMAFQLALPVLFLLLGYYLPGMKPNYFIGIRTPWTLESPENWRLTHQFAGRLWVGLSLAYIILEVVLTGNIPEVLFWIYLAVLIIPPLVYSWMIFQKSKKQIS